MAITRNVGTAAASIDANTTALQNALDQGTSGGETTIVLGANAQFAAVGFRTNITTSTMTIIAADKNNPPIMTEGFRLCGGSDNSWFSEVSGATSSDLRNITFDGIHFIPRVLHVVTPGGGRDGTAQNPNPNYTIRDSPDGLRWRIDPTFDGFRGTPGVRDPGYTAPQAFMMFFLGFSGTRNITIQNCFFRGGGRGLTPGGANGFTFRHNTWVGCHEDGLQIGGGTNQTIEYNYFDQCAPVSFRDANDGWGYGGPDYTIPPHCDFVQIHEQTFDFVYQYNEAYDDSTRAHMLLFTISHGGSGGTTDFPVADYHKRARCINNFARSSHPTQWWFRYHDAAVIERNKGLRIGSENVSLKVYPEYNINVTIRDNRAFRLELGPVGNRRPGWTDTGNDETNDPNILPPGWVEFRRGHANLEPGAPFAGQYGGTGAVVPTQPAALTAGQVAFEALVQDPNFLDARRTFTIRVPAGSPAEDAFECRWSSDADTTVRIMTQLADAGGDQIWRANSSGTVHLRSPNETFSNVKLYYREVSGGLISLPSTYTFTETVPDEGNPDPIVTDVIFVDQTRRVTLVEGDAFRLVTKEDGIIWQMPG